MIEKTRGKTGWIYRLTFSVPVWWKRYDRRKPSKPTYIQSGITASALLLAAGLLGGCTDRDRDIDALAPPLVPPPIVQSRDDCPPPSWANEHAPDCAPGQQKPLFSGGR